jgi:fatty acid desaturase
MRSSDLRELIVSGKLENLSRAMRHPTQKFFQVDGPTWLVALALYGAWVLLVWFNARLPWWVITPVGAYLVAWHFSLQHEAIHSFRGVPAWLRFAVAFPPLGLWFPYPLYRKSHTTHHRDINLTIPGVDTESYYVRQADWANMGRLKQRVLMFNQTMAGRLLIGPILRLWSLAGKETRRVRQGDYSHLRHWRVHVVAVGVLFWFISEVCGFPWWQYCLLVAYPGLSLGLLRAFTEHRAAEDSQERTASVESNAIFGLMYLYNNLHVAHHLKPAMPWYEIPRFYRENRHELLASNGDFVYRGYTVLARRYFLTPVFSPVHPTL